MYLPKSFLAPISEYTNLPFRLLCRKHGAEAVTAPLINVTALSRRKDTINGIKLNEEEKNIGVQLFGTDPMEFKIAAKRLFDSFPYIKWFDVNCGCPMENIVKIGAGAALLKQPKKLSEIVLSLGSLDLPVSIKMRILENERRTVDFCKVIEKAGVDFFIVHGRTPRQLYSGVADWAMIKKIKDNVDVPIVGNGDIKLATEGNEKVKKGYCDSFMIGRAAMKNPFCFQNKKANNIKIQKRIFLEYFSLCEKFNSLSLADLRQKSIFIFRGFRNSSYTRLALSQLKSFDALEDFVKSL